MDPEDNAVNRLGPGLARSPGRARGWGGVAAEFPWHATGEQAHADRAAAGIERIRFIGDTDPTRRMHEGIRAMEEEHADDRANLRMTLGTKE